MNRIFRYFLHFCMRSSLRGGYIADEAIQKKSVNKGWIASPMARNDDTIVLCKIIAVVLALISAPVYADEPTPTPAPSYIFNISYEDAEDAVSKALTAKATGGQIITAIISGKKNTPIYSDNKPISVEVRGLRTDSAVSHWSASLVILSNDEVISAQPIAGRYKLMVEIPVLKQDIKNGEVIKESDIENKTFPQELVHGDTVKNAADLIGKTPARTISPNRPIRSNEIGTPAVIKKNALVQMRYKIPNMEITTTGQAMADGAKGEAIEVKNTTSKKITRAVVVDSNTVDVMAQGVIK